MPPLQRAKPALGTVVSLALENTPDALAQSESAFAELYRLEKIFNRFDDESELSAFQRGAAPGPELAELLAFARALEQRTGGAFTLGEPIDLGGIAKGFIVDKVFERLPRALHVNAGGDLRVGPRAAVEIRAPGGQRYGIELEQGALATSIVGELAVGEASARYHQSARYAGASVVAATCAVADAATKIALFGDWKQCRELAGFRSLCLFDERGAVIHREG